jgi:hypothetical protein
MSERAVLYQDASGNEVTALDLVSSVTVSVGDKMSIKDERGNIQTIAPMISMTATIPPEQQSGEMAMEVARQLYAQINSMVTGITRQKMGLPTNGSGHKEEPRPEPERATAPPEPPAPEPEPMPSPEREEMPLPVPVGERFNFSPKAAERKPGDWWMCGLVSWNWHTATSAAGNEYSRMTIKYQDGKYPKNLDIVPFGDDVWPPKAMREHLEMTNDGQDHNFPDGYTITFMVGPGKNKAGNYEPLLVRWASSEERARLTPAA